ncbi:ParB/RepB/Spo0J family partition protein [Leucobacter chromiiresistens]
MSAGMELVHVDPSTLVIDTNVRTVVDIDPSFYESIRDTGVQQPPTGWRDAGGEIVIEVGQRRVLAAVRAKLPEIPVIVVTRAAAESEKAAKAERIVRQLSENDHRAGLTDAEHVAAYKELTLFGLTADQIAKKTKTKRDRVRAAVQLTKNAPSVAAAMATRPVTLDQALVIAEFDGDEARRSALLDVAESDPDELEYVAARLRREAAEEAELQVHIDELTGEGFEYISPEKLDELRDDWEDGVIFINDVCLSDVQLRAPTVEEAKDRGGLVVALRTRYEWDSAASTHVKHYTREYWITQPSAHGYVEPLTDDPDGAAEREKREAAEAEAARKAELETAWQDASTVRERWIINVLLCSKKPPEGTWLWVTSYMLGLDGRPVWTYEQSAHAQQSARWLGIEAAGESPTHDEFIRYVAGRRGEDEWKLALAAAIANQETSYKRHLDASYSGALPRAAKYLLQLQEWGHTLSEVERDLIDAAEQLQTENEAA